MPKPKSAEKKGNKRSKRTQRSTKASEEFSDLLKILPKIGEALNSLQPVAKEFVGSVDVCKDKPLCWSAKLRATNIAVTVVSQTSTGFNVGPGLASIQACPPAFILEVLAANEIRKKVARELCASKCDTGCRCLSLPLVLTIGQDSETLRILTGNNWQTPVPANKAACVNVVDVQFDIQLVVSMGICLAKGA
jgi:hypothetical protein